MKINEIPKEDLELMGYDDIAYYVLQESGKKMQLVDIFKKVIKTLEMPESYVEEHLMDFFEQMSTNKKFTMLKNGYWDLQSRHNENILIDESEDEDLIESVEELDEEETEEEDIFYDKDTDGEDDVEDDLADLVVIDEEEESSI